MEDSPVQKWEGACYCGGIRSTLSASSRRPGQPGEGLEFLATGLVCGYHQTA